MVDAPENIGLVRGMLGLRLWNKHDDNDQSNAIAYTRSDLVAELEAENERLKREAAEWEAIARAKSEEALTHRREAEAMMSALSRTGAVKVSREDVAKMVYEGMSWAAMCGPTPNGTVPVWEDRGNSLGQDEARRIADRILSALSSHPRATSTVDAHETANVSDKLLDPDMPAQQMRLHMGEMTAQEMRTARAAIRWANARIPVEPPAPEGQQPVAWLTNLSWIDSPRYTVSFEGDKTGCENFPVYTRPSEQAVTEAMLRSAIIAYRDTPEYDHHIALRNALKAAMEAG